MNSPSSGQPAQPPGGWPDPRSLYLHVPFCRHRCGYCNFSVVAGRDELADRFLDAVDYELAQLSHPLVQTVFVGGGTPTHLSQAQLGRLLRIVRNRVRLAEDWEWSVEANPEDIDQESIDLLADNGVNRISLGVQSFHSSKLQALERGHGGQAAVEAIQTAAKQIANLAVDLIFGAPTESLDIWCGDLEKALSLPITHLSTYALTYEKGTSFWNRKHHGELKSASETLEIAMYNHARQAAANAGLEHYEISNFAVASSRCRHNLAYWQGRGWYAVGPGAASFVNGFRIVNHRSPTTYLKRIGRRQSPVAESEPIGVEQYARERAAFGIRLLEGLDLDELAAETGIDLRRLYREVLANAVRHELIDQTAGRATLTEKGILLADSVA
ncbi:MAG: radical SAM family heme chaperone HemW, partial [Pirellulales bacterium]|nr:radical SAM family heme chaperone HemW [Pirellulales bacterium]